MKLFRSSPATKRNAFLSKKILSLLVEAAKEKRQHSGGKLNRLHIDVFGINSIQDLGSCNLEGTY